MPSPFGNGPVYRPLGWPFLLAFIAVLAVLAPILLAGVSFAFAQVGIGSKTAFSILLASLLGSWVNIPVWRLRGAPIVRVHVVRAFGTSWRVPLREQARDTILAVNLGGAVIPTVVCAWIFAHDRRFWLALAATGVVAVVTNRVARPVPGLGIAIPALVPALTGAATALVLAGHGAAPVAYVAGTLGTLLGADLLNLRKLTSLGAQLASIGGAGTFDGVFLSGVLGVILATAFR